MVRYRTIARLVLLAPLLLSALPADAQTRRIFAGASVIADNDQTNSALTESIATSWTFVVGMDATSHIGVRVIFDTPRKVSGFSEGIYTRLPSTVPVHERLTFTRRSMTYGLLADVHGHTRLTRSSPDHAQVRSAPVCRLAVTARRSPSRNRRPGIIRPECSQQAPGSGHTRSCRPSARAGWAKSTRPATRASIASSRSR